MSLSLTGILGSGELASLAVADSAAIRSPCSCRILGVRLGLAQDAEQQGRGEAVVGKGPAARWDDGQLVHRQEHAHRLCQVGPAPVRQLLLLLRVELAIPLKRRAAGDRDDKRRVQPDGVVLQPVQRRLAVILDHHVRACPGPQILDGLAVVDDLAVRRGHYVGIQSP